MGVGIDVTSADGLEIANGSQSHYAIGTLSPGESRHVQVTMSGDRPGDCTMHGQASIDKRPMDKASCTVRISQPALTVAMEGPKLRFVDRRAAYTITVQNPGPAPIDNVQLMEKVPDGFRFVEASSGGNYDRNVRQVAWFVGRLEANETATVGVQLIATEAGDHRLNAAAKADCGVVGEAETTTRVKGAPHVAIDVSEDDDPVEIDGETIYRVRLSNMGSTPARRVQFAAEVPREMEILETSGPSTALIKGQQLVFPPVAVLEPGQSASYDVHVRCKKAGQVRFKAYFRSEDAPDPVLEEETTRDLFGLAMAKRRRRKNRDSPSQLFSRRACPPLPPTMTPLPRKATDTYRRAVLHRPGAVEDGPLFCLGLDTTISALLTGIAARLCSAASYAPRRLGRDAVGRVAVPRRAAYPTA